MTSESNRRLPKPKNGAGRDLPAAVGVGVGLGALVVFAVWAGAFAWYMVVAAVSYTHLTLPTICSV